MTVVSSRVFLENPIHYFNLALKESVAVKRGKRVFRITPEEPEYKNTIDPEDPYWDDKRRYDDYMRLLKRRAEGKMKFTRLTPERQKELLGL